MLNGSKALLVLILVSVEDHWSVFVQPVVQRQGEVLDILLACHSNAQICFLLHTHTDIAPDLPAPRLKSTVFCRRRNQLWGPAARLRCSGCPAQMPPLLKKAMGTGPPAKMLGWDGWRPGPPAEMLPC